jgi:hypothetical protein
MLSLPQAYFDTETKTNTGELLILKKTIDIVKHISCAGTSAPTAFPTAFPTTSPTSLSNTPTSFPTRAPTAVPTGAPTANPTAALSCTSGTWMFMSKVFANPDRFGVPAYADGVVYNIPTTMGPDTCAKIETSHSNVGSEGMIQTIMHQYKCCGNSGRIYGAVSMDSNPTPYPTAAPTPACVAGMYLCSGICKDVKKCGAEEYETTKPTATTDRACTPWSDCPTGEGLLTTGTATKDVVCQVCAAADYKFSLIEDRSACKDHTKCGAGQGSTFSTLTDATKEKSACDVCDGTVFYSDVECYGPCKAIMVCALGAQYESSAPTASADRICRDVKKCGAQEYEVSKPTATADRVCATPGPTAYGYRRLTESATATKAELPTAFPTASPTTSPTPKFDLCDGDKYDHCGLFGANMYTGPSGNVSDPSATDPSGNVTTNQTTAPTASPTSFPTRAPSDAPTAYPTKAPSTVPTAYPTKAPSDYPTALAHADDALQTSTSSSGGTVYNITDVSNITVSAGM